jgi:hypothetical protein
MAQIINAYNILIGKHEAKRSLGRSRHRCKDSIKKKLRETGQGNCGLNASGSGFQPVAGCCEHSNEPSGCIKGREFLD